MTDSTRVDSFRRKLVYLIALRVASVTILLGSGILVQINTPGAVPAQPLFLLIAVTYGLTVLYALTLRQAERHRWLVDAQLASDAVLVSAAVFMTGGVNSYFSMLYVLPIVASSVLQFRRGGLMLGSVSALAYGALVLAQYRGFTLGLVDPASLASAALPPVRMALYQIGLNAFGFLGVALLSGHLAEGLREAGASLERASTEIADLQAFNQHVIESLTSGLATTDHDGRILTFNRAAQAITGHSSDTVVGRYIFDVFGLADVIREWLQEDYAGTRRLDFGYPRADGRPIEIGLSAAPLLTPSGRVGFLFHFQDVTQMKKMEREARMQQRLAAVGEMAAGIAHEIRNPLASMSGSIQILRQELPLNREQAQLMDIVLRESERLNETIRSFLAYARPQRFSTARVDLRRVITDTALLLRNSSECRERHSIDLDLPDAPVVYEADENQMRQIVWNLATNGLRAMPGGGALRLAAAEREGGVAMSVADQGIGIPAAELESIFHPFRSTFSRGTGLGLAIVHRIITDYGGTIQVTSEPGRGTRVEVQLPGRAGGARPEAEVAASGRA